MPRILVVFLLLLVSSIASAQVQFAPTAAGTHVDLNGKTVKDGINVRLAGCPTGPWVFALDNATTVPANTENTCPFALLGDDTLLDTKTLTNGPHKVSAQGPTGAPLEANFTVANTTPQPPVWTGSATLGWIPPTKNKDGSALTNLAGYKIYYGAQPNSLGETITVSNPGLMTYIVDRLPAGKWYFAMTALNDSGGESDETPTIPKTLTEPVTPPPTCPAQPALSQPQPCVAPTIGSWTQSRTATSVAAPACWDVSAWTPATAPAGVCAAPSPLVTAGPLSYYTAGSVMTSVGYVAAGLPCGPDTKTVGGVKFCRIAKGQTDLIGWPVPLAATDLWARAQ